MQISDELKTVSDTIIWLHREIFQESPSPMKLQKLCYYAQGYYLVEDKELFPEDFQAWQHGPVIDTLYSKYRHLRWAQITKEIEQPQTDLLEFLHNIVSAYGRFDGAALSTMSHRETPWLSARGDLEESEGSNETIAKDSMKAFFTSVLKANG